MILSALAPADCIRLSRFQLFLVDAALSRRYIPPGQNELRSLDARTLDHPFSECSKGDP